MDYLIYAYLQLAQDDKAKSVLDELRTINKVTRESTGSAYAFAAIPARYVIERRQWAEASTLEAQPATFPWNRFSWARAIIYYARGVCAAHKGDVAAARAEEEKLAALARDATDARGYNWADQIEIQKQTVAAWAAYADGKKDRALEVMRAAADLEDRTDKHPVTPGSIIPAREMLGELLVACDRPAE